MTTDLYTRVVLTVIAACLVILVVRGTPLVGTAHAEGDRVLTVDIVKVGGYPLAGNHVLPVDVREVTAQRPLPVNLKEVAGSSFYGGTLPVDVSRVGGSSVSGALPVKNH